MTTIRDIARHLNLSIGAVSRALDGYPDISAETRARVQQAARDLGYVPNRAARQLRRQRADAIGFILPAQTPRFADPFYSEFLAGLGDETARHRLDLVISSAPAGEEAEQRLYQAWVQGRRVDGVVLNRLRLQDWRVQYMAAAHFPFSSLEFSRDAVDYPGVAVEGVESTAALVAHLVKRGFTRLAFIGGPPDLTLTAARLAGFKEGLQRAGLNCPPEYCLTGDLTSGSGYQAARHLAWLPEPPTALVCVNDETAIGAMRALAELGLQVGRQVAVTGFDGVQVSAYTQPALTTVDQPVYEIACLLVRMLIAEIQHRPLEERRMVLQPHIIYRESA